MSPRLFNRCECALLLFIMLGVISVPVIRGQDPHTDQLPAPPPLRVIPKTEKEQLLEAKDPKLRVRKTIVLVQTHLQHAEQFTTAQKYTEALTELGVYAALIEDALKFVGQMNRDRTGTRDLYKSLELDLREDGPRLTSMRRITPLEYAIRIKEIEDLARDGRAEALDSFYGHTVIHDGRKKPEGEEKPTKPEDKQP
jgi:hypothetical protein